MGAATETNETSNDVERDMEGVGLESTDRVIQHETLAEAFVYAQMEFQPIVHNCVVDFKPQSGRQVHYTYADLAQVQKALYPALNSHGLSIHYDTKDEDGRVSLIVIMSHAFSTETREARLRMTGAEETKELAAKITYLKRYLLGLITGTASEEDSLDQQQNDTGASESDQHPGRDKTQPKAEDGSEKPDSDNDKDAKFIVSTRILGNEIGIEDVKKFLGLEASKSLTQEEWKQLNKDFKKYKTAASWFSAQITKDISEIGEFAAHRALDWPVLYPDIKKAKDALEKGKDESLRDELWAEFTDWNKSKDTESVDEDADDLAAMKAEYSTLIDGREGWETKAKRKTEEAKLSKNLYAKWGINEHIVAIKILTDNDASDAAFEKL